MPAAPDADSRPTSLAQGSVVEDHVRRLAAHMGVADFVYQPAHEVQGGRSREISDGLLIVGDRGVILQVKSRDRRSAVGDDEAKAERWILKKGEEARRQGIGTRRRLRSGDTSLVSLRGHTRVVPPSSDWPIVVILDHPLTPATRFDWGDGCLFMSMNDWISLHARVRSTAGVVRYIERAIDAGLDVPLGGEVARYQVLADADLKWSSFSPTSVPHLPPALLNAEESASANVFDSLLEFASGPREERWSGDKDYLRIIETLDSVPTLMRVSLGSHIRRRMTESVDGAMRTSFTTADRESGDRMVFLFSFSEEGRDRKDEDDFIAELFAYATLRHLHGLEAGAPAESTTLAVGIRNYRDGSRRHGYVWLQGDVDPLPSDIRASLDGEYGVFDGQGVLPAK